MASSEQQIRIYQTEVHPCSYLDGRDAVTEFLDPKLTIGVELAEKLSELGFRRSGQHTYRPQCPACSACIPLRVQVADFEPGRTQRKILNRNQDLTLDLSQPVLTLENYRLYRRYINERHQDGDMYPPSAKQFSEFLGVNSGHTQFWNFRKDDRLLGIAVTDHFPHALSSVYSFFSPDYGKRSLGVYFVLRQIMAAKKAGLSYLYLGYWIKDCRKMSYKISFPPLEQFTDGMWKPCNG